MKEKYLVIIVLSVVWGLFALIGSCSIDRHHQITKMVIAGADPLKARLSLSLTLEDDETILYGMASK